MNNLSKNIYFKFKLSLQFPNEPPIRPEDLNLSYFGKIRDLKNEVGNLGNSDWLDIFNHQLPKWLQVKHSDDVVILNYQTFFDKVKANKYADKR